MKTLSTEATAAADRLSTEVVRVMQWTFLGGDLVLRLCDRVWDLADGSRNLVYINVGGQFKSTTDVFWTDTDDDEWAIGGDAVIYEPFIDSWGQIKMGDIDIVSHETDISEVDAVNIINNMPIGGKQRFVELFRDYSPQYSEVLISEFFFDTSGAVQLIDIFKGQVEDIRNIQSSLVTVVLSGNELDVANKFSHNILTRDNFANCRLSDAGKFIPQFWGRASRVPLVGLDVGKDTTLVTAVNNSAVTFDITDKDGEFPTSGTAYIESEQITWTGKSSYQLTGITRGTGGTTPAAHDANSIIHEDKTEIHGLDHAVNAIDVVYAMDEEKKELVRLSGTYTAYTGQSGDEHGSYADRAVVEITTNTMGRDARIYIDGKGYQDDGSGTYTGTPDALIELPTDIAKHVLINRCGKTTAEIGDSYAVTRAIHVSDSYRLAPVIMQRPNVRLLLSRIAIQSKSLEFWEAGVHEIVAVQGNESVDKYVDANRIDLRQITLFYSPRSSIQNYMTATYSRDWSSLSDNALINRYVVYASDTDSIARYGTLEGDQLAFPYIIDEAQAQDVLNLFLTERKNSRLCVSFAGGYYCTDMERGDIFRFDFDANDYLDESLSFLGRDITFRDRPTIAFRDRSTIAFRDLLGSRSFRVTGMIRRNDAAIQIEGVEVV